MDDNVQEEKKKGGEDEQVKESIQTFSLVKCNKICACFSNIKCIIRYKTIRVIFDILSVINHNDKIIITIY